MNGLLIIDKPAGMTSFDVVRQVRRMTKTRRVGHAGTLDPMATGVLPVAVGTATRLIEYLMAGDKAYRATLKLGSATDTQDSDGQVIEEKSWQDVDLASFSAAVENFIGDFEQLPPMYSALKKDGQPLYKLARQGIEVEREPRMVHVESLTINEFSPPYMTFTVACSKGTYVRTICHDIGQILGCGAHMTDLRRLSCGRFDLAASHPLQVYKELSEQGRALPFLSLADILADWKALTVDGVILERLQNGVAPHMADLEGDEPVAGDKVRLIAEDKLVAIARYTPEDESKRSGDFELLKVFPLVDDQS
ncbi:MAG: tRNA pseudouridine(55) synthase TruB [Deltaproteobacteria bacterium]|jgi:tRNA pseudouridine55 synthase|nr:tRNA pseudouridine(55) synthase TruB [Deltaproteobacteria bacterium]